MSVLLSVLPFLLPLLPPPRPLTLLPVPAWNCGPPAPGIPCAWQGARRDTRGRAGGWNFPFICAPPPPHSRDAHPPGSAAGLGGHRRQGRGWRARCRLGWPQRAELGRVGCCWGGIFPWGGRI